MPGVRWHIIGRIKSMLRDLAGSGEICQAARQSRGNGWEVVRVGVFFMILWIVLELILAKVFFGKGRWTRV